MMMPDRNSRNDSSSPGPMNRSNQFAAMAREYGWTRGTSVLKNLIKPAAAFSNQRVRPIQAPPNPVSGSYFLIGVIENWAFGNGSRDTLTFSIM